MQITTLALVLAAVLLGLVVGWFAARARAAEEGARLSEALRAAQERSAAFNDDAAARLADAQRSAREQLESVVAAWTMRLEDERRASQERLGEAKESMERRLADERAGAVELLERERASAAERLEELRSDTRRLAEQFDSLSKKALEANSVAFLEHAEERLKRTQVENAAELTRREQAVQTLVEPLTRTLGEIKAEVTAAEKARLSAHSSLSEQVRAMQQSSELLRDETSRLVTALRAPQVRGRWGELQLRRIVEASGMVEHVDFEEQESVASDDGMLRPDLVVKLPGAKQIVVDAKVAFSAYLEAMEARDDAARSNRLEAHARHVRKHIDDLGSKAYWEHVTGAPEFVVMFVPAEVFLNAALEQDPTLLEHAFERNVVVATPATLVALLRTVGYTWRQEMLAAEAQQVFTVGRELHKRLSYLGRHLTTLGKRLNASVEAFNALNTSLDRNIVTQARRFSALQGLEPALESTPPLEILAVAAHKPDVHADGDLADSDLADSDLADGDAAVTSGGTNGGPHGAPSREQPVDRALTDLVESELRRTATQRSRATDTGESTRILDAG